MISTAWTKLAQALHYSARDEDTAEAARYAIRINPGGARAHMVNRRNLAGSQTPGPDAGHCQDRSGEFELDEAAIGHLRVFPGKSDGYSPRGITPSRDAGPYDGVLGHSSFAGESTPIDGSGGRQAKSFAAAAAVGTFHE